MSKGLTHDASMRITAQRTHTHMPRPVRFGLCRGGAAGECLVMMTFTSLPSVLSGHPVPFTDQLRLAVAAYLARFKGAARYHSESGLRCYLAWCAERGLDPLAARRPHLELYIRWMQEIRRFRPSTVSRRFSVTAGFYRTCVIDGLLEHSPAGHVRRPSVPPESPTLRFTHLQFGALLTAARESSNTSGFALVAMLGLLGLRIFEATGADIADLGEEHGHRVLLTVPDWRRAHCLVQGAFFDSRLDSDKGRPELRPLLEHVLPRTHQGNCGLLRSGPLVTVWGQTLSDLYTTDHRGNL